MKTSNLNPVSKKEFTKAINMLVKSSWFFNQDDANKCIEMFPSLNKKSPINKWVEIVTHARKHGIRSIDRYVDIYPGMNIKGGKRIAKITTRFDTPEALAGLFCQAYYESDNWIGEIDLDRKELSA